MGRFSKITALDLATYGANVDIVKNLLGHGASINIRDDFNPGVHLRRLVENYVIFKMIFDELPQSVVDNHDVVGFTALHYAAIAKAKPVVEYLLKRNADINHPDQQGMSALHHASLSGEKSIVEYLVEWNADINLRDEMGRTALYHAAAKNEKDVVQYLLEHNADINIKDLHGANPILYSIMHGAMEIFASLLPNTDIVNIQDEDGNNALHYTIQAYEMQSKHIAIVKHLREKGVDMNAKNNAGYTPFFAAVLKGHIEVVKELLLSKERIKIMEECDGKTPIQIAYDNDFDHIKRALLECDVVSRYMETLYRDRQVYVDAANAILVGVALIAIVTFASWLQPPLGYTALFGESYVNPNVVPSSVDLNYVDVQHNKLLRGFWVFNCLSFYFAIATVVFGARSVLPRRRLFIKETVEKLRLNLLVTCILLACAMSFVIVAFGIAGCIVLTPILKFQWYMIGPTIFGGIVCLVSLVFLFKTMLEDVLRKKSGGQSGDWLRK